MLWFKLGRLKKKKSVLQSYRQLTTVKVASQGVSKEKSTDKGKRYRRRARDGMLLRQMLEANAELSKDVLGKDLPEQDFAKRMVDMVNQRKKHFAEE
ncbi:hypothetical protein Tco_1375545 [Tanacetum coccineum]